MSTKSVKVAVRVRPFSQRELDMDAVPIIEIEGKKTRIHNTKVHSVSKLEGDVSREAYKDFTFDYSYWSFNTEDSHFASQEQVFQDLGTDVVRNAFEGYNACVFAYGQTGSGKTHTMMGAQTPPSAQGLIPRICMDMFNRMSQGKALGTTYSTEVSYLEIYNERVKDLLTKDHSHNLKVREHPRNGPYVEDLSKHMVRDYVGILDVMNRGNANRTTASTNMNDTSSRSHAIFTMTFVQASLVDDMPSETVSKIHLVDLAGSERADATGATGTRLKEGAHINKSLVTLGSVISALAEVSQAQNHRNSHSQKQAFIPYRDSVLTWLLKDSLGGNSKTIMIATISPADCNHGETLSTLRYANRAKNIINKPTINEDPNVKLIRELRAEIDKLKRKLASDVSSESAVLAELHKKEAREKSLTEEWTEKWKETQKILMEEKVLALRKAGTGVVLDSNRPHLIGIDDDVLSTGITLYHLKEGETKIGSEEGNDKYDIMLKGLGLESQHCSITLDSGVATLIPCSGSLCWVNGQQVSTPTRLFQGCVVLLGRTSMFRYNDPAEAEKLRREGSIPHFNLSRLSFLSRSVSELGMSSENLDSSALGEESNALEEKRKQLEAEEVRLQKESLELLKQKQLLEEQKCSYQQLQQQKEQAWTADIQSAQKDIEVRKQKLEQEYAAHRHRLAEDWKRLEQQEQETLASLQSKEADLKKRRELLEWEVDQEMEQIEAEAVRVDALKATLEKKQAEVTKFSNSLNSQLQEKLGSPDKDLKPLLLMQEEEFQEYLKMQVRKIDDWKVAALSSIVNQRDTLTAKMMELSIQMKNCDDPKLLPGLEKEQMDLKQNEKQLENEANNIEQEYGMKISKYESTSSLLEDSRRQLAQKGRECEELNADIEKGISRMLASEGKIGRLESDLALIADQEKLIVSQLAHIDNSKQKLLTIIENSTEVMEDDTQRSERSDDLNTKGGIVSPDEVHVNLDQHVGSDGKLACSRSESRDPSPNRQTLTNQMKINEVSPIHEASSENHEILSPVAPVAAIVKMCTEEVQIELKRLIGQINDQKAIVLECLENDSDTKELNNQMALLQQLRSRYLQIESLYEGEGRQKWFGYDDDDDDSYMFDKNGGGDTTPGGESELDDSEALSSVTDQEDHIQMLVEQRVEKRLQEIFDQLRAGKKPRYLLGSSRRSLRRSMPSDLNQHFGSDDDILAESPLPVPIPRSMSMNSVMWPTLDPRDGVIPGLLDICILNYMLRGAGNNEHYQYEVFISTPSEKWSVLRRYTRFYDLRNHMKKKYGNQVTKIAFPGKRIFRRRSESVAMERKKLLEEFLKNLIQLCCTFISCPLHNCEAANVRSALIAFSSFFEKGIFDSTKYGTS